MHITIGSRGSDLALWQAHFVENQLQELGHEVTIKIIETRGDRIQDLSFDKIEGKGFFTKEIENALLNNEIDLAVHSHKDLETTSPEGLMIGAVSYREDPSDILLIRKNIHDENETLGLPENSIIGTSSARRQTQMRRLIPTCELKELRGNVPTRINKLRDGQYDAIVLATAGIKRLDLDLSDLVVRQFNPTLFIPAPAQGVLGLQIREADTSLSEVLAQLNHADVAREIQIERGILKQLEGGCQLPLGVYCEMEQDEVTVHVSYAATKEDVAEVNTYSETTAEGLVELIVEDLQNDED